ncbi:MAG: H+/Na+-translocating ferredoxin:NAD+ oxidoreductase subunit [Desulfovibrionales bacterium]|nr:H+/Na+-translocating ferredoxin:NAD+ oxidoreductase subunit [Desulfovibrionales bacterium]
MQNDTIHLDLAELTLEGRAALVSCGQDVKRGQRIAISSSPGLGDLHSPVAGKVEHVDPFRIRIKADGEGEVEPVELNSLKGEGLLAALRELGADLPMAPSLNTLIINGVDEEQGIGSRRKMLASHQPTLERGLSAVQAIYAPAQTVLAVLKDSEHSLAGTASVEIAAKYPSGLDPLVALAATGKEAPEDALVLGLETVFQAGRIMETGLPAMETVVTCGDSQFLVAVGTPAGAILAKSGQTPKDRDRIVLGGVMRGTAASSPRQGVSKKTSAVMLVKNPTPVALDAPCVGCGQCVQHCPARIDPSMITSYAEFGMYDKAEAAHIDSCFECGICGYYCIARRPMLQYIRLAKCELAKAKAQAGEEVAQ